MNLKTLRQKNNLTQQEVAQYLNKTKAGYSYYESGRNEPDIKALIKLADLYHVSIDELVGRKHENQIDKGLLSDTELSIFNIMKELNPLMLNKLESYALALHSTQQDQETIKNKVKGEK